MHLIHRWQTVKDTGFRAYQVCARCGKRRITPRGMNGFQPVDRGWLETGRWTPMGLPPRPSPIGERSQ
jgi:hypothetical protein